MVEKIKITKKAIHRIAGVVRDSRCPHAMHERSGIVMRIFEDQRHDLPDGLILLPKISSKEQFAEISAFMSEHPELADLSIRGDGAFTKALNAIDAAGLRSEWNAHREQVDRDYAEAFLLLNGFVW